MKDRSGGLGTRASCILAFCACAAASHGLQPLGLHQRGWQGETGAVGAITGAPRVRGWSGEQQVAGPKPVHTPPRVSPSLPHQSLLGNFHRPHSHLPSVSSIAALMALVAAFVAGYAAGVVTGRRTRLDKISTSQSALPASLSSTEPAGHAKLGSPAGQADSHACANRISAVQTDQLMHQGASIAQSIPTEDSPIHINSDSAPAPMALTTSEQSAGALASSSQSMGMSASSRQDILLVNGSLAAPQFSRSAQAGMAMLPAGAIDVQASRAHDTAPPQAAVASADAAQSSGQCVGREPLHPSPGRESSAEVAQSMPKDVQSRPCSQLPSRVTGDVSSYTVHPAPSSSENASHCQVAAPVLPQLDTASTSAVLPMARDGDSSILPTSASGSDLLVKQQGPREGGELGAQTFIILDGENLSLPDAEVQVWMMSVLRRIGVRATPFCCSTP